MISLAFLPLTLSLEHLTDESVTYHRSQIQRLLRALCKEFESVEFETLCFKLENIVRISDYYYMDVFLVKLDDNFLFKNLKVNRAVAGSTFLHQALFVGLAKEFRKSIREMENVDAKSFSITHSLNIFYSFISRVEKGLAEYLYRLKEDEKLLVENYFKQYAYENDLNIIFYIKEVCSSLNLGNFSKSILNKIGKSSQAKRNIQEYSYANLVAYTGTTDSSAKEWSNKIYLISLKTLAILEDIEKAKNNHWKIIVGVHALSSWLNEAHEVLNFRYIDDDFSLIKDHIEEEGLKLNGNQVFINRQRDPLLIRR